MMHTFPGPTRTTPGKWASGPFAILYLVLCANSIGSKSGSAWGLIQGQQKSERRMKFTILINAGPYTHQASDSALHFARAALDKGHTVTRIFFYGDGVYNANKNIQPPTDERNLVVLWCELASQHNIDLVVCVAAANRRGIQTELLATGFRISGLGQLVEAGIDSDRLLVFGD